MQTEKIKKPLYKRAWFVVLCILVILGILRGVIGNVAKPADPGNADAPTIDAADDELAEDSAGEPDGGAPNSEAVSDSGTLSEPVKTLGITPEQFTERMNTGFAALGSTLQLSTVDWDGEESAISAMINDRLGISLVMSADTGHIASIIFIGTNGESGQSNGDVLLGMSAVVMAADPTIAQADTGAVILELLDEDAGGSITRNGITFAATQSEQTGTWLIVEPK